MDISTNGNVYLITAASFAHNKQQNVFCVTIFPRGLAYFVLSGCLLWFEQMKRVGHNFSHQGEYSLSLVKRNDQEHLYRLLGTLVQTTFL